MRKSVLSLSMIMNRGQIYTMNAVRMVRRLYTIVAQDHAPPACVLMITRIPNMDTRTGFCSLNMSSRRVSLGQRPSPNPATMSSAEQYPRCPNLDISCSFTGSVALQQSLYKKGDPRQHRSHHLLPATASLLYKYLLESHNQTSAMSTTTIPIIASAPSRRIARKQQRVATNGDSPPSPIRSDSSSGDEHPGWSDSDTESEDEPQPIDIDESWLYTFQVSFLPSLSPSCLSRY